MISWLSLSEAIVFVGAAEKFSPGGITKTPDTLGDSCPNGDMHAGAELLIEVWRSTDLDTFAHGSKLCDAEGGLTEPTRRNRALRGHSGL